MYIETYKEYKKHKKSSVRNLFRNLALNGLIFKSSALESHDRIYENNRIQFLYLHHIFKDEINNLFVLINLLKKNHTFISYSEAVERLLSGSIDKPYIVFSTDDGLKSNLNALEAFQKFNIKACFFVNPDLIYETNYEKIKNHCRKKLNSPPLEFLNPKDIEILLKEGHEIGSHTMAHENLNKLSSDDAKKNICLSYEKIVTLCGNVKHFAFPYGTFSDFNKKCIDFVHDSGFESIASAVRGAHANNSTMIKKRALCIRRDHVILAWNIQHSLYFIRQNAKNLTENNNFFPY